MVLHDNVPHGSSAERLQAQPGSAVNGYRKRAYTRYAKRDALLLLLLPPLALFIYFLSLSTLFKPNLEVIYAAFWAQETNEGCKHLNERTWPSLWGINWANTLRKLQGKFSLILSRINNSSAECGHGFCHHIFTSSRTSSGDRGANTCLSNNPNSPDVL